MKSPASARTVVRFGIFEFHAEAGELRRNGMKVRLAGQPIEILSMLLERPGRVVTREELRARLWPADTFVEFEHSLNAAVMRLREALGDSAENPRFVETVPRRGYRFIAPVSVMGQPATEPVQPAAGVIEHARVMVAVDAPVGVRPPPAQRRRAVLASVAGIVVVAGLLATGAWRMLQSRAPRITSLAVLPLANFSADPAQEFFADGMTEELTADLSKIEGLRVISRTSVMRYKGTRKPLAEIARELNVDGVIEGSVQRDAGRVRVTVQLLHAPSERHLWSASYERELKNLLALRAELARDVADQVRVTLTPQQAARIPRGGTTVPAAYDAFLKARHSLDRGDWPTAIRFFELAVRNDPKYALAWADLAEAYEMLDYQAGTRDHFPQRDAADVRARQLDENLSEVHTREGDRKFCDWDWLGGEAEYRRGVELDPSSPDALQHYGMSAYILRRPGLGLVEIRRAQQLDPLSASVAERLGSMLEVVGDDAAARFQYQKAIELDPGFARAYFDLGGLQERLRENQSAAESYLKGLTLRGVAPEDLAELKRAYAQGGLASFQRLRWQKELLAAKKTHASAIRMAQIYLHLGEHDQALEWLEKAYDQRVPQLMWINLTRSWDPVRSDPRFQEIIRKMHFPEPS